MRARQRACDGFVRSGPHFDRPAVFVASGQPEDPVHRVHRDVGALPLGVVVEVDPALRRRWPDLPRSRSRASPAADVQRRPLLGRAHLAFLVWEAIGNRPRSSVSRRRTTNCSRTDTPSLHAPTTAMGFKKVAGKYCCGRGSHGSTWTTSVMIGCRRDDTSLASHGLRWERSPLSACASPGRGRGRERDTAANAGERGKTTKSTWNILLGFSLSHPRSGSW